MDQWDSNQDFQIISCWCLLKTYFCFVWSSHDCCDWCLKWISCLYHSCSWCFNEKGVLSWCCLVRVASLLALLGNKVLLEKELLVISFIPFENVVEVYLVGGLVTLYLGLLDLALSFLPFPHTLLGILGLKLDFLTWECSSLRSMTIFDTLDANDIFFE